MTVTRAVAAWVALAFAFPTSLVVSARLSRWLRRRADAREIQTRLDQAIQARLEADVAELRDPDLFVNAIRRWQTDRPLDPRDVELWIGQLRGPEANEQIYRELNA